MDYRRVLFKISGESLAARSFSEEGKAQGICPEMFERVAIEIKHIQQEGISVALVLGGGNFFRGIQGEIDTIERSVGDQIGMLATIMNGLALGAFFTKIGVRYKIFSGIDIPGVVDIFQESKAKSSMDDGCVVIFVGGTGVPYFTTDTAAAVRAGQLQCDIVCKGTKVDGIYSSDPYLHKDALKVDKLTYNDALDKKLKIMDETAMVLLRDLKIPCHVFSIYEPHGFLNVLRHQGSFSTILP